MTATPPGHRCRHAIDPGFEPPKYTRDSDVARRLWDVDASLVGLGGAVPA